MKEKNLLLNRVEGFIRSCMGRLDRGKAAIFIIVGLGLFSFFSDLNISFRDTEGKYAVIAREMLQSNEWLHLRYEGQPYFNKPPLHFWLMGTSSFLFGQGEFGFRFPTAVSAIGTMLLVYYFGQILYNRRTGFIAALIVATNYDFVWYSKRALLDTELTFFITFALLFFFLSYRNPAKKPTYLILAFTSMALGTMIKGLLAIILPGIVLLGFFLINRKELRLRKEIPALIVAGLLLIGIIVPYHLALGEAFNRTFLLGENIHRFFGGSKSYFWYFYMIFLDFFPWAFFLPSAIAFIWPRSFQKLNKEDCFALLWGIGFFLFFTMAKEKSEHYILPLIPPFALLIARFWDNLLTSEKFDQGPYFVVPMSYLLALMAAVGLAIVPPLVQRRHGIPSDFVPILFIIFMICICLALIYLVYKRKLWASYATTIALAVGFTFGLIQYALPAFDRHVSGKLIGSQTSAIIEGAKIAAYFPAGHYLREDVIFYLNLGSPLPQLKDQDELFSYLNMTERVFCLLPKSILMKLQSEPDRPPFSFIKEFYYGHQNLVLISNEELQHNPS